MVRRVPRKKDRKASPEVETSAEFPAITDEEWDTLFRQSVMLRSRGPEPPPVHGTVLTPAVASGEMEPPGWVTEVRLWDGPELAQEVGTVPATRLQSSELAEVGAEESAPVRHPGSETGRPALSEQEWREGFFQRGRLTGLLEGDDLLILTAPDVAGGVTSLRLRGDALTAVAAAALQQDADGFDWRDHDDLVLLGLVLDWCLRGVPLESRPAAVQIAVSGLAQRYSGLIGRLAALLPPR